MVRFALNYVRGFVRQEEAQDLLEYALLVALIAIAAAGAVGLAGNAVDGVFDAIVEEFPSV